MPQSHWRQIVRSRPVDLLVYLLGALSLAFSFYAISVGFHNTLFDFHGFRQTQTAMGAESIRYGAGLLHYEIPVLGPPWSLPFEFPLYQAIVAGCSWLFSTPLVETGRFLSVTCYYLCFFPLTSILIRCGLRWVRLIPPLALFAVSPIYIFVSRLFMIESTALLLSLLYTDQVFRLSLAEKRWQMRYAAGAALFGVGAGMVKVTTLAPYFAIATAVVLHSIWQERLRDSITWSKIAAVLFTCIVLPVAATLGWTRFADAIKAQNPFGIFLTSTALNAWNFGTFAQRIDPRSYPALLLSLENHLGNHWAGLAVLIAYIGLCRRSNWIAIACAALYVGTVLLFFNLYVVHEYYSYATALFLVVSVGVLIAALLEKRGLAAWAGAALLLIELGACVDHYSEHFYDLQSENDPGRESAAAIIDRTTRPQDIILIKGLDWSPELPWQSHRRAIMDWNLAPKDSAKRIAIFRQVIASAGRENVTEIVSCGSTPDEQDLPALLEELGMVHQRALHADGCDIYPRDPPAGSVRK